MKAVIGKVQWLLYCYLALIKKYLQKSLKTRENDSFWTHAGNIYLSTFIRQSTGIKFCILTVSVFWRINGNLPMYLLKYYALNCGPLSTKYSFWLISHRTLQNLRRNAITQAHSRFKHSFHRNQKRKTVPVAFKNCYY